MNDPRSLPEWLDYIGTQHSAEIVMGLTRVRTVWQRLGKPQAAINIIVGGTNGKGSTCAMLACILQVAGYRTGFYSSPHLIRYNERIQLNGNPASDAQLCAAFAAVEAVRTAGETIPLTYFEYSTLAALWLFAHEGCEVAILEVGLGGRLDAVNIVDADVSIVTSVDLDHQQYLGDTREQIGYEKAAIYRPGRPAIFADSNPPDSLLNYATEIGASLLRLNHEYRFQRQDQQWQFLATLQGQAVSRHALPFPALRGSYQLKNASAALMALATLQDRLPVSIGQIKRGLLEVQWPGRMQIIPGRPAVVLDVAHNPHAARALEDALGTMGYFENTYAVFGMLQDKDIDEVIDTIKGRIDHWFIAGLPGPRGASSEMLADKLRAHGLGERFTAYTSIASAYQAARGRATQNDRILAFGSFYTVADVMQVLGDSISKSKDH